MLNKLNRFEKILREQKYHINNSQRYMDFCIQPISPTAPASVSQTPEPEWSLIHNFSKSHLSTSITLELDYETKMIRKNRRKNENKAMNHNA